VVHSNCSGTAFFTASSCLPTAILPLHCTQASFASYRSSPPGRPWLPATLRFKCFRYFKSYFQVFHPDIAYVAVLYTYVESICFKCFSRFRHMFQVFH
jgi:hypothetical protein